MKDDTFGRRNETTIRNGMNMKIAELKITSCEDRAAIVSILAFEGYKVSIDERKETLYRTYYYVIVEEKEHEKS